MKTFKKSFERKNSEKCGYPVDTDSFQQWYICKSKNIEKLIRFLVQWANWNTWY